MPHQGFRPPCERKENAILVESSGVDAEFPLRLERASVLRVHVRRTARQSARRVRSVARLAAGGKWAHGARCGCGGLKRSVTYRAHAFPGEGLAVRVTLATKQT